MILVSPNRVKCNQAKKVALKGKVMQCKGMGPHYRQASKKTPNRQFVPLQAKTKDNTPGPGRDM
jgi:hypothetical protein